VRDLRVDQGGRRLVAAKGLARSHIVVLDALLKLRQVCCDPRLVELAAALHEASGPLLAQADIERLFEPVE
jgi:SNF2 family DNA or RNA helicase